MNEEFWGLRTHNDNYISRRIIDLAHVVESSDTLGSYLILSSPNLRDKLRCSHIEIRDCSTYSPNGYEWRLRHKSSEKTSLKPKSTTNGDSLSSVCMRPWMLRTSDAGSQYRCGRVGRGIQPPSTPQPTCNTQTYTKSVENARFPTLQLDHHDRRTNGPRDGPTDGQSLL